MWAWSAYWVDFSTVTSGLQLAEYSNNHLQNKLSIFTHYKVIKLLLYYQEFVKNQGSMKSLSDHFDALYIYDNIERVINLKLIDKFNNLFEYP